MPTAWLFGGFIDYLNYINLEGRWKSTAWSRPGRKCETEYNNAKGVECTNA